MMLTLTEHADTGHWTLELALNQIIKHNN